MTAGSGGPANLDAIEASPEQLAAWLRERPRGDVLHPRDESVIGAAASRLESLAAERDAARAAVEPLREFAERVAALGDPDVPDVLEQRRRVTLGQLIAHARRALDPGAEPEEQR